MITGGQAILPPLKGYVALGGILVDLGDRLVVNANTDDAGIVKAETNPSNSGPLKVKRDG